MMRIPLLWLVIAVTALVFLPVLAGDFVWDDNILVVENQLTGSWENLPQLLRVPLWDSTPLQGNPTYYRPLMLLSLLVDRTLFGLSPMAHHVHSMLWHLLAVGLAGVLMQRWLRGPQVFLGLLLFAIHPLQIETVAFVAARNDSMAAVFVLVALLMLCGERQRLLWAMVAIMAAALCKESVFLAPLLYAAVELARTQRLGTVKGHAAILAGLLVVVGLRQWLGMALPERADVAHILAATPPSIAHYAQRLLMPAGLVPGLNLGWPPPVPWLAMVTAVGLCSVGLWFGRIQSLAGLLFAGVALGPAIVAIAHVSLVPDRYMYLPLLGLSMALGAAVRSPGKGVLGGSWLLFGVVTLTSLSPWQNDVQLWHAAHQAHQTPYTAAILGRTLELQGDLDQASALYRQATSSPNPYVEGCYSVARVQLRRGDLSGAVQDGEAALAAGCPPVPELIAPLSVALAHQGNWDRAEQLANQVQQDPTGMAVVVRVAAAWRRGDSRPMDAAIRQNPSADPQGLYNAVASLLGQPLDAFPTEVDGGQ